MIRLLLFLGGVAALLGIFYFALESRDKALYSESTANTPSLSDLTFSTIASSSSEIAAQPSNPTNQPSVAPLSLSKERDMVIDTKKQYTAVLHTSEGDITVALHASETPITVNNFVTLSQKNFYNNTIFHRVIKGFMIQGGDPLGNGTGGPGYKFNDEPFSGNYERGVLAMANAGANTNGSQFFIMHQSVDLPHNYVIFGNVISGIEVVDKIAGAPVTVANGERSKPVTPVVVKSIEVTEK